MAHQLARGREPGDVTDLGEQPRWWFGSQPSAASAATEPAVPRLPGIVGGKLALEILLTGDPIDARRAYEIGLVNRLVNPGEALTEARRLASRIAGHAPAAVDAVLRVAEMSLAVGEADADALARNLLHGLLADDYARGRLAAFGDQVLNP
jgi:enoyl-CoA hydratase